MGLSAVKDFANSTTAKVALAGAIAIGGVANVNAQSLPYTSGCHDGPTVEAAIAKDGQKPIFTGKRLVIGGPLAGNVITMNDNGYGYNLERDPSTNKLCLVTSFKNVQLNYPDNPNIPPWGLSIKPNNGIDVSNGYKPGNDGRLVFRAQTYSKDSNGNEVSGKAIVVAALPLKKLASVWAVDSKNIPDTSFDMKDFGIVTTNFNYFMGRGFGSGFGSIESGKK